MKNCSSHPYAVDLTPKYHKTDTTVFLHCILVIVLLGIHNVNKVIKR